MTATPSDPTAAAPGRPPVVDPATWQPPGTSCWSARRPTPARATPSPPPAARRRLPAAGCRLPMVEFDPTVEVVGPDGPVPVPFLDLLQGRAELVAYKHMWYDGAPHQGQCEGCTMTGLPGQLPA